ncbi:MAG: hypothetical protein HOB22_02460 [Candidatus Marinimicrobia bacterium]|nr:hypothetical protein [Candidatus Neomarinimicrobiota bacterium]MBT5224110.1 hypothetical protein [Candidatus Neomarinimicrobiota bacterium]MBT6517873.1 hypothetical protein [Candidatus Neomarinimicrobiota bacterium]MBT6710553.1 hypothetical protein [Candidatus Neomarinimicrobiota bacterium]
MNSRSSIQLTFFSVFILFSFPLSGASNTFEDDIKKLSIFQTAFDQMYLEMGEIKTSATRHETGHFSNVESDKIENLLFRYLVLRRSVWDIINKYQDYNTYSDYPHENMKALLVGYTSALTLYKYSGILITKNMGDDQVIDKLNEAYFRSDIPRGSFREVYHSLTNLENLDKLDIARELITTEMDEPGTPLNLLIMDPTYGPLITNLESLHYTHVKLREEILNHFVLITPELTNRLRHSTVKKKVENLIRKAGGRFKALKAIVFTHVGHIKAPGKEPLIFSEDDKNQLLALLQPGDIILTYSEGFMSNIFLPGIFKHGIVYTGKRENWEKSDWDKIQITDHQKSLIQLNHNIIEAIAEGVVSGPLEEILDTKINRLAVFRPDLSNQEIMGVIQTIHSYLGNQYDFSFDFNDAESQVCTEVIYRGYNEIGNIQFGLSKRAGTLNLSAEDVCRYAINSGNMELVTLVVEDEYRKGKTRFFSPENGVGIILALMN